MNYQEIADGADKFKERISTADRILSAPILPARRSLATSARAALSSMPTAVKTARANTERWLKASGRYPNIDKLNLNKVSFINEKGKKEEIDIISMRSMRPAQSDFSLTFLESQIYKSPERVLEMARKIHVLLSRAPDRTIPINAETGEYAAQYVSNMKRLRSRFPKLSDAQLDQVGLKRFVIFDSVEVGTGYYCVDFHMLDRDLHLGTLSEMALWAKDNRAVHAEVEALYQELMELLFEHILPRSRMLSQGVYGTSAPDYKYGHQLRHSTLAIASHYNGLYLLSGDKRHADSAAFLFEQWLEDWKDINLPGGLVGRGGPHFIRGMQRLRGYPSAEEVSGWHNLVYLEETMPRLSVLAHIGGTPIGWEDVEKATTLLAFTFPQYGWTGKENGGDKIPIPPAAGDMGGGGSMLSKAERKDKIQLPGGKLLPAHAYLGGTYEGKGKEPDRDHLFNAQRGGIFAGAAYTKVPNLEENLKTLDKATSGGGRGWLKFVLETFELKRAGKLPRP